MFITNNINRDGDKISNLKTHINNKIIDLKLWLVFVEI